MTIPTLPTLSRYTLDVCPAVDWSACVSGEPIVHADTTLVSLHNGGNAYEGTSRGDVVELDLVGLRALRAAVDAESARIEKLYKENA